MLPALPLRLRGSLLRTLRQSQYPGSHTSRMRLPLGLSKSSRARESKLQELVETLRKAGATLGEAEIQEITRIMGLITIEELGLEDYAAAAAQSMQMGSSVKSSLFARFTRKKNLAKKKILYIPICETDAFHIALFCFPGQSGIPLHDHPGMTVFSRVMYGTLHVKGYDWLPDHGPSLSSHDPKPVVETVNKFLDTRHGTIILRPSAGGNIHTFSAEEHSAVLDVLCPPYCKDKGRDCTYYKLASTAAEGALLFVREDNAPVPDMIDATYKGVRIDC